MTNVHTDATPPHAVCRPDLGTPSRDPPRRLRTRSLEARGDGPAQSHHRVGIDAKHIRKLRGPALGDVVRTLAAGDDPVSVATYLLSPGALADRVAQESRAAGAYKVTAPIGVAPELVELIRVRWLSAGGADHE